MTGTISASGARGNVVYFATSATAKAAEAESILTEFGIALTVLEVDVPEPLMSDLRTLVAAKVVEAYRRVRVPVFVEHGGLYITALNNQPGCLSKVVFEALREKICAMIPSGETRHAEARSAIAYCDGKKIHIFEGAISGTISNSARGTRDYYYDSIFVPDGQTKTYAEMDIAEKNTISHVRTAYENFASHLVTGSKGGRI
ncbi:non-canonical purine NTP pyrophosphatase [Streptomyces scabiei]|uniref:non-canonical purine NTP pyrophosphatase n=1 Tax=Streptomyces scabiei TaxID=1930 RepID=UPI00099C4818|nr:non-canonical purine NTP pyrophosphatase [Streptomyces scabiei]